MEILASNLSPVSHILTSDIDVTRIESHKDIEDEDEGNGRVNHFVLLVLCESLIDILKRHNEGVEDGKDHNKDIPSSLVLRQITECLNTTLRYYKFKN